jgi:hypothetical protein
VPSGFRPVPRKGTAKGLARYTNQRLDATLLAMRTKRLITLRDDEIDTFQRIANVETGGMITALNTWDSAYVSIGFMQWTLAYGELQHWIATAAPAFRRFGIEVDPGRTYALKSGSQPAIRGASGPAELRWDGWAERFWLAGFDPEAIAVEVRLAAESLERQLRWLQKLLGAGFATFMVHYRQSPWLRAIFHETYNNRPAVAKQAFPSAVSRAAGVRDTAGFVRVACEEVVRFYRARGEEDKALRLIEKTKKGAQL